MSASLLARIGYTKSQERAEREVALGWPRGELAAAPLSAAPGVSSSTAPAPAPGEQHQQQLQHQQQQQSAPFLLVLSPSDLGTVEVPLPGGVQQSLHTHSSKYPVERQRVVLRAGEKECKVPVLAEYQRSQRANTAVGPADRPPTHLAWTHYRHQNKTVLENSCGSEPSPIRPLQISGDGGEGERGGPQMTSTPEESGARGLSARTYRSLKEMVSRGFGGSGGRWTADQQQQEQAPPQSADQEEQALSPGSQLRQAGVYLQPQQHHRQPPVPPSVTNTGGYTAAGYGGQGSLAVSGTSGYSETPLRRGEPVLRTVSQDCLLQQDSNRCGGRPLQQQTSYPSQQPPAVLQYSGSPVNQRQHQYYLHYPAHQQSVDTRTVVQPYQANRVQQQQLQQGEEGYSAASQRTHFQQLHRHNELQQARLLQGLGQTGGHEGGRQTSPGDGEEGRGKEREGGPAEESTPPSGPAPSRAVPPAATPAAPGKPPPPPSSSPEEEDDEGGFVTRRSGVGSDSGRASTVYSSVKALQSKGEKDGEEWTERVETELRQILTGGGGGGGTGGGGGGTGGEGGGSSESLSSVSPPLPPLSPPPPPAASSGDERRPSSNKYSLTASSLAGLTGGGLKGPPPPLWVGGKSTRSHQRTHHSSKSVNSLYPGARGRNGGRELDSMLESNLSSGQQSSAVSEDEEDFADTRRIRKQLEGLEHMYGQVLKLLKARKQQDRQRLSRRGMAGTGGSLSSLPTTSSLSSRPIRHSLLAATSRSHQQHNSSRGGKIRDIKGINKRFQRLESHVVTLARSVAHLSSEMRTQHLMIQEMEVMRGELASLRLSQHGLQQQQHNSSSRGGQPPGGQPAGARLAVVHPAASPAADKVKRLTKFFGDEPPLLRLFLRGLGYEKYAALFEKERIGLLELPYLSEERLNRLGIPLGPRLRILQEAHLADPNTLAVL